MSRRTPQLVLVVLLVLPTASARPVRAQVTETSVTLAWTAPGDDDLAGQATAYDLRWSLAPITTFAEFVQATPVIGLPLPQFAGAPETATVTGLVPATTYWFALRTQDEVGNLSPLSNVLSATTAVSTDIERPAPLVLTLDATTVVSATLSWNDVGDDSLTGNVSAVEVRWSTAPITEANWAAAPLAASFTAPGSPGTPHQLVVPGLDRTRDLWFAGRARDDVNQVSALGAGTLVPHLLDSAPPSAPGGLTGTVETGPAVRLRWSANAEPDLAGYHVYRAPALNALFFRLTVTPTAANDYLDASAPDSASRWYAVTAVDATGNESARSAAYRVLLGGGGIAGWTASPPFPNPSRVNTPVTIPLAVPATGPFDATAEILNAAGEHVRTLRVVNATAGPYALTWDGRNDAGRDTVPGVYRVWLHADGHPQLVRMVRIP